MGSIDVCCIAQYSQTVCEMSKERLYSCLIHKTSIVLLLEAVQKPKADRLLDAKTEAAFCLCRVHLIIRDDRG